MKNKYFASSNSYYGFYSLFGNIFNSNNFDSVFVLKGGPGTGKSTFMRNIAEFSEKHGGHNTLYHCSSDTSSIDGIIAEIKNIKIAIIDGTAPHERDAIYVGATDEIINLGESIDLEWIKKRRENIISLSNQKSSAYKTAYSYLKVAGECYKEIYKSKLSAFDKASASKYIRGLHINEKQIDGITEKIFVSSFGKNGYKSFGVSEEECNKTIKISGDDTNSKILLNFIISKFAGNKMQLLLSPLFPELAESVIIGNDLFTISNDEQETVRSDDFFTTSDINKEEIRLMTIIHNDLLKEATRWFSIASDIHFKLEDIYGECMNFENNQSILSKICKKIIKVCECDN